jgi:hypothetical protein
MDRSQIRRLVASRPVAALNLKAQPSQGQLLQELLTAMAAAVPTSGTKKFSATEIGGVLKLAPEDLARFVPLVVDASITSTGIVSLVLREEFRYRPTPESRDLLLRLTFRGTISSGKLEVVEGLAAIIGFLKTNIQRIEEATEENKRGVRVVAGLGSEFYPI